MILRNGKRKKALVTSNQSGKFNRENSFNNSPYRDPQLNNCDSNTSEDSDRESLQLELEMNETKKIGKRI